MNKNYITLFYLILIIPITVFAGNDNLLRHPSLNSDGSQIAFSFQGDIWKAPVNGGTAQRLTLHEAFETRPVWNKTSDKIAFTSTRFGNIDIFVMDADGSVPKRLTYHSTDDIINSWTADDEILFITNRTANKIHWMREFSKVSADGGTPERILDAFGSFPTLSPSGRFLAFVRGNCRIEREAYEGSANRELWLYDYEKNLYHQLSDFDGQDYNPVWTNENTLYFLSARDGRYNVYKMKLDADGKKSGDPKQITSFNDFGVRNYSVSANGKKIVIEVADKIYVMNSDGSNQKEFEVTLPADYRFYPTEKKTISSGASEYEVSPDGKLIAFVSRGEVFVTENDKEKSKAVNISNSPAHDQHVAWLSDSTLIFCSDREGQFDFYLAKSADKEEVNLFKTLKRELVRLTDTDDEEAWPVLSHDRKKIAFEKNIGELYVADIDADGNLSNEIQLIDSWDAPGNVAWSPDDKWLSYSHEDLYFNSEIYIQAADGSKERVNVSMHPKGDYSATWSPDGSKLAFVSERNNRDNDVWFVWLNKADWLKSNAEWDEEDDSDNDKKKDDDSSNTDIRIDFENIHERLEQVTRYVGNEGSPVFSKDGETIYFVKADEKARNIYKIKFDGDDFEQVTKGKTNPSGLKADDDVKNIYFMKRGGKIAKISAKSGKMESLPFKGKMLLDHKAERLQVFEEGWRQLNHFFYDPDFHGQSWTGLKKKYKPIAMKASTYEDFRVIFNEMLGQVNASHMGLYGSGPQKTQNETTARLGIEVKAKGNGVEVLDIIPNSPADREDSKLNVGDVILSVDGEDVVKERNFYSYLEDKAGEKVLLEVERKNGETEEFVIRPTRKLGGRSGGLLYEQWVDSRKQLVEKYSGGRLGYIHIRGMDINSFERFERELTASGYGKEGIVIDVRFNGGGWTTDYLLTVLNVRQHAYTIPRGVTDNLKKNHTKFSKYYPYSERLPYAWLVKPSIALCNSMSYSNAEIFSHAYKTLGLGTLVGEPTFGAVISTWGTSLLDGSFLRLPRRGWYVKKTQKNMDFEAAVPDIIVPSEPGHHFKGDDAQLKAAVKQLLKEIDEK